jgi:uncharacterized protein (TIGR00255 family)
MLYSMTGYGAETLQIRGSLYNLELKSLNSKGFDFVFKSPSLFRNLEIDLKNQIQTKLERGKVELSISFKEAKKGFLAIDENTFIQQYAFLQDIAQKVQAKSDIFSIVVDKYSSLVEIEELNAEEIEIFNETISALCDRAILYRKNEGAKTTQDIVNWVKSIEKCVIEVARLDPVRVELRREKLLTGIREFTKTNEIDYNRLGQEIIYYIEKFDVSEEISRLNQHLSLFTKTVSLPENTGKKLGFISQEIGREVNTIGSKANDAEIQHVVVEMKDLLERIKEQLNNIV